MRCQAELSVSSIIHNSAGDLLARTFPDYSAKSEKSCLKAHWKGTHSMVADECFPMDYETVEMSQKIVGKRLR